LVQAPLAALFAFIKSSFFLWKYHLLFTTFSSVPTFLETQLGHKTRPWYTDKKKA
jgi:hypothetical protein